MNRIRLLLRMTTVCATVFILSSCAEPPVEEERAATDAMEAARRAEAPEYAPTEWSDAEELYAKAGARMDAKEYDAAKIFFTQAVERATAASKSAIRDRAELRDEIELSTRSVSQALTMATDRFKRNQSTLAKKQAVAIAATIKNAQLDLANAIRLTAAGQLMDAKHSLADASTQVAEATVALGMASSLGQGMADARQKSSAGKPRVADTKPGAKRTVKKNR